MAGAFLSGFYAVLLLLAFCGVLIVAVPSPWMTAAEAAVYVKRGRRFVLREIHAGRLRAARVGGRGEILTRREWCDQWVEDQATPIALSVRRRA